MKVKVPNSEPVGRNNGLPTKAMAKHLAPMSRTNGGVWAAQPWFQLLWKIWKSIGIINDHYSQYMDVGQNGRPRGPQMWMSSLVLTIHNFGVPNFDPYPYLAIENGHRNSLLSH